MWTWKGGCLGQSKQPSGQQRWQSKFQEKRQCTWYPGTCSERSKTEQYWNVVATVHRLLCPTARMRRGLKGGAPGACAPGALSLLPCEEHNRSGVQNLKVRTTTHFTKSKQPSLVHADGSRPISGDILRLVMLPCYSLNLTFLFLVDSQASSLYFLSLPPPFPPPSLHPSLPFFLPPSLPFFCKHTYVECVGCYTNYWWFSGEEVYT